MAGTTNKSENQTEKPLCIRSVRSNYLLNSLRLALSFLVPVAVFPYVSRILGPENLGKVEFANSIVSYFVLFTSLGIPAYGIREIARLRDSTEERSRVVWELTLVLLLTAAAGYAAYFVLVGLVPRMESELALFCIVAPNILLSDFSYEWYYVGIEDQMYITIRCIIVRLVQTAGIFLFIRNEDDYPLYALILVGMQGISTVFNITNLRKTVRFVRPQNLDVRRHLRPVLVIFASVVAVQVYTHLDVTMTGFFIGDRAVGLYTTANKFVRIVIALVTSLSTVMVPRIENCLKNRDEDGCRRYLNISLGYILILSVPCSAGIAVLAPEIISLFAGSQYQESVLGIRLLSPVVVIVGLAHFTGLQILFPRREEWKYTAAVNLAYNLALIPVFRQNGAIIGTLAAELVGLAVQIGFARKYLKRTDFAGLNTVKYFIAGAVMGMVLLAIPKRFPSDAIRLAACVCTGAAVYAAVLLILREKLSVALVRRIFAKGKTYDINNHCKLQQLSGYTGLRAVDSRICLHRAV